MTTGTETDRKELRNVETALRDTREERKEAVKRLAKAEAGGDIAGATRHKGVLAECDLLTARLEGRQSELLPLFGGAANGGNKDPRSAAVGGDGWPGIAREMCATIAEGGIEGVAFDSLFPRADVGLTPSEGLTIPSQYQGVLAPPRDMRFITPWLPRRPLEGLGITDWKQDGPLAVEGEVERDLVAKTEKATIEVDMTAEAIAARLVASTIKGIQRVLLEDVEGFGQYLAGTGAFVHAQGSDAHVVANIHAAKPPQGEAGGEDLLGKIRSAVGTMRDSGVLPPPSRPDQITGLLVLNTQDAADLDNLRTGADEQPVFATRATGSASPLWGLQVIETPGEAKPLIIDPQALGMLFIDPVKVHWNPFTGQSKNEVELLVEGKLLYHVRNAVGAYVIDKAAE